MSGKSPKEQLAVIRWRAVEIVPEKDLLKKLERSRRTGRPLRVKLGIDPTAPDIHLGFSVVLWKLREFQDLGHTVVLIVGDFTARIGDPSGRKTTRPLLSAQEIKRNMQTYIDQLSKILDLKKTEIRYNSEWLEPLTFKEILELTSRYTVARLLERDDFAQRLQKGLPIAVLELLYPLAQAYDSMAVKADVEIGGTDQTFNFLAAREIMERYGLEPQVILTMPLLPGTDGVVKMSKSVGNYIGITEPPNEMFGKLMSIPDEVVSQYVHLLTELSWEELVQLHPMERKKRLAYEIVALYHHEKAAQAAQEEFERIFSRGESPKEAPRVLLARQHLKPGGTIWIIDLLQISGLVKSRSEARRLIEQGAVELNDLKIESADTDIEVKDGALLRVGKHRFAEIQLSESSRHVPAKKRTPLDSDQEGDP